MISNSQIMQAAQVQNPVRMWYELESPTTYDGDLESGYGYYSKGQPRFSYHSDSIVVLNSIGSPVASFNLKQ